MCFGDKVKISKPSLVTPKLCSNCANNDTYGSRELCTEDDRPTTVDCARICAAFYIQLVFYLLFIAVPPEF
jgi:hypothetical protein